MKRKSYGQKIITMVLISALSFLLFQSPAIAAIPSPPAGLAAIAGNGEISLTWNPVDGAMSYAVYRGQSSGGPYSFVARTQGTGHINRGLTNGTTYYYVATALNGDGQSPYSSQATATPKATVLPAPAGLTAVPGNGEVTLSWNPVTSAVSYNVYRATSRGGPYTLLTPAAQGPGFTDRGLTNDAPYFYVVQTMSTSTGAYSEEAGATPSPLLPAAPATFTASPGSTWASLSWSASEGAIAYAVYRGTKTGGPYTLEALPNTTVYEDSWLSNGTTYYYVVAAVNANGRGALSVEAVAAVSANEQPHATVLIAQPYDKQISLNWGGSFGATAYTVHRRNPDGTDTDLGIKSSGYTDTGLVNGTTYTYWVDAHNASSTVARSNEVAMAPTASAGPAPDNITVIPGNTQATLTWNPVANAWNYAVTIAESPGGPSIWWGQTSGKTAFTATNLPNGRTYYIRIQSQPPSGAYSADAAEVSVMPTYTLPLALTQLEATPGNTQISLTWPAVTGATGYEVYRKTEGSAWSQTPIGSPTATLFTDTGLTNGTRYDYRVAAVNAAGSGAWSPEVSGTPTADTLTAPTDLAAIPGNTQATVTWKPVVDAWNYAVTIAESPGGPSLWWGQTSGKPYFTFTGLTNDRPYYIRIQSQPPNAAYSAYAAEVSVTPAVTLPLAPTHLDSTPGNTQLSLTWPAVPGATGYRVYRRTEGKAWGADPIGSPTATLFTDMGLANGTKYIYSVAAVNAAGAGAWSPEGSGTPTAVALPAPTGVAAVPGNRQLTVLWEPVAGAWNYAVTLASSAGGPSIWWGQTGGKPEFTAINLTNDQTYYIRIQSQPPDGGSSAYSAEVSVIPAVTLPQAPTYLDVTPGNGQLSLTWTAVTGATGYRVYRRSEEASWPSEPIASPAGTLFTDTGLVNGTKYYYIVAALNEQGAGTWSPEATGTPTANTTPAPVHVAVTPSNMQATVTWDPVAGVTAYYVTVATSPGGPATGKSGNITGTIFAVTGLDNGQPYYFRVQAAGNQLSAFSAEVSAIPNPAANIGNISGRVSVNFAGNSSLGVANASVSLQGTGYSTTPDADGNFTLLNVPFGNYQLVITAPDMDPVTQNVSLSTGSLNVTLPKMVVSSSTCPPVIPGDANGDGLANLEDVIYLLQMFSGVR
jgi:fibronectin type 3 domain-containing protein